MKNYQKQVWGSVTIRPFLFTKYKNGRKYKVWKDMCEIWDMHICKNMCIGFLPSAFIWTRNITGCITCIKWKSIQGFVVYTVITKVLNFILRIIMNEHNLIRGEHNYSHSYYIWLEVVSVSKKDNVCAGLKSSRALSIYQPNMVVWLINEVNIPLFGSSAYVFGFLRAQYFVRRPRQVFSAPGLANRGENCKGFANLEPVRACQTGIL